MKKVPFSDRVDGRETKRSQNFAIPVGKVLVSCRVCAMELIGSGSQNRFSSSSFSRDVPPLLMNFVVVGSKMDLRGPTAVRCGCEIHV